MYEELTMNRIVNLLKVIAIVFVILGGIQLITMYGSNPRRTHDWLHASLQRVWFEAKGPSSDAEAYFDEGNALYDSGHCLEAIEAYDHCISIEPAWGWAYYKRALAKHDLKMYALALEDYSKAIKHGCNHANAYYNRAVARWNTESYSLSDNIDDFKQAIKIDPNHDSSYYNLGLIYKSQYLPDWKYLPHSDRQRERQRLRLKAIDCFKNAIRSNPKFARAYVRLGEIKYDMELTKEAKHDFIKALSLAEQANDRKIEKEIREALKSRYNSYSR